MHVELDDSIPDKIKQRCVWAIKYTCLESHPMSPVFSILISGPAPKLAEFTSALAFPDYVKPLEVRFRKAPLDRPLHGYRADDPQHNHRKGYQVGWRVTIDPREAERAIAFIEKHYG